MVPVVQQDFCLVDKVLLEIGDLAAYPHRAQGGLSSDVGVRAGDDGFNFGEEIARHFDRGNVSERYEGEPNDVLVGVVKVATRSARFRSNTDDELLQRIRDQGQDLLVFIQKEHGAQVSQPLVGEAMRGQQLQTFDLAKVRALSEGEEVQKLRDIVPSAARSTLPRWRPETEPDAGVVALLPEARAYGGALLLHDGALVGDGLGGAHVADELLD